MHEGRETELAIGSHEESSWYLRVADVGVGIAVSDCEHVFDEFERAAGDDVPGVGLGPAIVRELCRLLQGSMRFESREGHGTTVEIRFPVQLLHACQTRACRWRTVDCKVQPGGSGPGTLPEPADG